jgi:hypothetical protein
VFRDGEERMSTLGRLWVQGATARHSLSAFGSGVGISNRRGVGFFRFYVFTFSRLEYWVTFRDSPH